jgi:fucose permease
LCEGTFASWIVIYLEEERGVAAASAALALSTFWAALVLGRLTVGFAARRFADHVAWVSSMLTAALMLGVGAGAFVLGALRQMTSLAGLYRWSSLYAAVLLALVLVVTRLPRRSAAQPARLTALPKGEMP